MRQQKLSIPCELVNLRTTQSLELEDKAGLLEAQK